MRWIPLALILFVATISGLYIVETVTNFEKRRFDLTAVAYLTFLGMILFSPISFDGSSTYVMPLGIGSVNLHQLDILDVGFAENIILTVPLGFLIKKTFSHMSLSSIAFLGFTIGGGIETTQYFLSHLVLINRTSDINDVISNAIGIVIGAVLMMTYNYLLNSESMHAQRVHR
jgi:VanZ like family.